MILSKISRRGGKGSGSSCKPLLRVLGQCEEQYVPSCSGRVWQGTQRIKFSMPPMHPQGSCVTSHLDQNIACALGVPSGILSRLGCTSKAMV